LFQYQLICFVVDLAIAKGRAMTKLRNLIFAALATLSAEAGWVIEEVTQFAGGDRFYSQSFIDKNRYKSRNNGETIIIDLNKATIYFIYEAEQSYYGGELNKVISELRPQTMSEMSGEMDTDPIGDISDPLAAPGKIEVVKTGEKIKRAGFEGEQYRVIVDGELRKEMVIAPKLAVGKEIDSKKLNEVMLHLSGINAPNPRKFIELSDEYNDLIKQGYPIRVLEYDPGGELILTQVIKADNRLLSAEEFLPPKSFKRITSREMLKKQR
jgi:hypothetical protein